LIHREQSGENADKLIEMDESLHHIGRGTFRTFTVRKGFPK